MESWSYVSEEKGLLSNDTLSSPNRLSRTKNPFLGWELKTPCNFADDKLVLGQQNLENQGFEELCFPETLGKHLSNDPIGGIPSRKVDFGAGGEFISPVMAAPNAISGGDDSNSKLSNSVVDSSSRDSHIDLKLGRFGDHRDAQDSTFSKVVPILSSSESSKPPKRARASGLQSQTAYCQVYGCSKDLSASKDYHKRHKVCEVHSKTAKVIVNGIEQRFCQQCSRFHLLVEFDDGKRSCRKRLAGHNERRRKPHVGLHSGKPGRLPQPYNDGRFQGTMLTAASFIRQEIHPSGVLRSEKYGTNDGWRPTKVEDGTDYRHLPALHITNSHPQSMSPFPSYNVDKQFPFLLENGATSTTGSIFCENNGQYLPAVGGQISGPRSLFHETSLGSEDLNVFDTASSIQGLSGISNSGRALSLLSSQSQNSSSRSSGIPMARPLVIPSSHSHYSASQVSDKIIGISSQASTSGVSNRFPSEMNASDGSSYLGPLLISNSNDIVNFDMADRGIFQGSDFVNANDRLSCGDGSTIDLLRLSSQLQRVEDQKQSMPVKQENDSSCSLRITYGALEEET